MKAPLASSIPVGESSAASAQNALAQDISVSAADARHSAAGGSSALPGHQPGDAVVWQYPSEQMFYNAMKRKGWDAKEEDMPAIVAIHNGVNERAWHQVCQYEVGAGSHCGRTASVLEVVGLSLARCPSSLSPPAVGLSVVVCQRCSARDRLCTAAALPGSNASGADRRTTVRKRAC